MGISLTQPAADHLRRQLQRRGQGLGIRLGVRPSGCAGLAYVLDFVDEVNQDQQVFEDQGVKVFIASGDLVYLDGLELDYRWDGLKGAFQFKNPNARGVCCCGDSFAI
ncbi:iron-sulfur cluster assembly accessory protein [Thioalkalicoccus limnaeus]|uniref:Iron-sulfur cluster assembly accessory protein n=1 Tax=Thioalkalicoccus limnaeus TaxID=120681 RepID=A0ABV4BCD0_9GAMM